MQCDIPLPYPTDVSGMFAALRGFPWPVWLDSGGLARYDILTAAPVATLLTRGVQTEVCDVPGARREVGGPLEWVRRWLGEPVEPLPGIPFAGGAVGYWGYDWARCFLGIPELAQDGERLPEVALGIYDWAIVVDHERQEARLVSHMRHATTEALIQRLLAVLRCPAIPGMPREPFNVRGAVTSGFGRASYRHAFDAVRRYLAEGDCYQINLAQRFAAAASGDAYPAYLELRRLSPAPYSAFLDFPEVQVLCVSPERFLQVQQGKVQTRPIKGTRPRSHDSVEDRRLAEELRQHPKDRAENLMIVDLLRNDLGKTCLPGSVRVQGLFEVESYVGVHHLVSTIEGELQPDKDALDVLRACFPGGSITGAPKQRAMEIIEALEPYRRGIYCGAIGYIGFDGNMDTNIAIRTMVYSHGEIRCWAGSGIVADSDCDAEYRETLDKAAAMLSLLQRFGGDPGALG